LRSAARIDRGEAAVFRPASRGDTSFACDPCTRCAASGSWRMTVTSEQSAVYFFTRCDPGGRAGHGWLAANGSPASSAHSAAAENSSFRRRSRSLSGASDAESNMVCTQIRRAPPGMEENSHWDASGQVYLQAGEMQGAAEKQGEILVDTGRISTSPPGRHVRTEHCRSHPRVTERPAEYRRSHRQLLQHPERHGIHQPPLLKCAQALERKAATCCSSASTAGGAGCPPAGSATAGASCSASFLPSSTPHWSKELIPQTTPCVKTLCS
jgi:hypothetical protein